MEYNPEKQELSYSPSNINSIIENSNNDYRLLVYYWTAFFNDKTVIPQFDLETGVENSFKVVQEREESLTGMAWLPFTHDLAELVSLHTDVHVNLLLKPCTVVLNKGQRIIVFRRNQKKLALNKSNNGVIQYPGQTVYALGWQETLVDNKNVKYNNKVIMYLYEDGSVKLVSNDKTPDDKVASYGGVFGGL